MTADWRRPAWIWGGAAALAVARTGIGVVALAAPEVVGRPWVGEAAGTAQGRLLARALGGRDLALGLGALAALRRAQPGGANGTEAGPDETTEAGFGGPADATPDGLAEATEAGPAGLADAGPGGLAEPTPDGLAEAGLWVGMGAVADSLDVLATMGSWPKLPAVSRWLVALSAGGAAAVGGAAAWALVTGQGRPPEAEAGRAA